MHSLRTECSIRVMVIALLEYIDLFSVECPKGQIMLQNSSSNHYAQNYSGIIPASLSSAIHVMTSISWPRNSLTHYHDMLGANALMVRNLLLISLWFTDLWHTHKILYLLII